MEKFLVFASIVVAAFARPDGLQSLNGNDGHVSVTQSTLGTYKYTVHLKDSYRTEERFADGTIVGEYTIPDANGLPQTIKYTSGVDGFRILEGPLPVAPVDTHLPLTPVESVLPVLDGNTGTLASRSGLVVPVTGTSGTFSTVESVPLEHVVPVVASHDILLPVEDTPEVKAAREEFLALYKAAAARTLE